MFAYSVKHLQPEIENAILDLSNCMDGTTFAAYKEIRMVIKFILDFLLENQIKNIRIRLYLVLYIGIDWAEDSEF